jgi:hypothetical protein
MQKIFFLSLTILAVMLAVPAYADELSASTLSELVENGKALDGTEVSMTVEMIGDAMNRGDHAWVNGLDSTGAMGLWIPSDLASKIKMLGNGNNKGDTFSIRGVFHRACQEHGGDMDIHVNGMEMVAPGYPMDHVISQTKIKYALFLTFVVLIVGGVYMRKRLA